MILLIIVFFTHFNPYLVMDGRKKQFINNIQDIAYVASNDSISISYYWKNGYEHYRIDVNRDESYKYRLIYDSERLWKINDEKKEIQNISFLTHPNLWAYNWLINLPSEYKWKDLAKNLFLIEYNHKNAHINLWINYEGVIKKVKVNSAFGELGIEYTDYIDLEGFPRFPKKWTVKCREYSMELEITKIHINEDFCTPCTFKIPTF